MNRFKLLILLLVAASLACTLTRNPPPTLTPLPPTFTPNFTATAIALLPTETYTPSPTAFPTDTPLPTSTPTSTYTPSPTDTPLPTSTPYPEIQRDNEVLFFDIPNTIQGGLSTAWLSFTLTNSLIFETSGTENGETAMVSVYLANPINGQRVKVIDLPSSVGNRIYWSPTGLHLAYFIPEDGLYLLDVQSGRSQRLFKSESLLPRGIIGHQPVWSPDGTRLAFVLPTAYATDIYIVNADGTNFQNITNSPTYDFWPAWSPDGTKLAFVSDRLTCPSWYPNVPDTCDQPNASPPQTGALFVYEFIINRFSLINANPVNSPPEWINTRLIGVSSGSLDPLSNASDLWVYDVAAGSTWRLNPDDNAIYAAPAWEPNGQFVMFQRIEQTSEIIFANRFGEVIQRLSDYIFVRYGLRGHWSPDGTRLAIGGSNRQCPYGILIFDTSFELVNTPSTSLLACDPVYDPTGRYVAYEGIRVARGTDGRLDIIIADQNGVTIRNLTSDLEGELKLLGWVGPTFGE